MKQIYFTFCRENYSVSGKGGDCARAASEGISGSELNEFKKFASWSEPEGLLQVDAGRRCMIAPRALKFRPVPIRGGMIIHATYALPDEQTKRDGNYFAHVLTDLPQGWGAREALELWDSCFWVSKDSAEIKPQLPDVESNAIPKGKINESSFVRFLQSSEQHVQLFRELLENWLLRAEKERFVLLAKPEAAAFCLWGLTRILPRQFWSEISFSVYEKPGAVLNYDVTAFSSLEETFSNSDQQKCEQLMRQWPAVRVLPRGSSSYFQQDDSVLSRESSQSLSPEKELVGEWISLVKQGAYASIDQFFKKVPVVYYRDRAKLRLLWRFWYNRKNLTLADVQEALMRLPELREDAENIVKGLSKLEDAFRFFDLLTPTGKDLLLERLWKEKTLKEVRQEPRFSTNLIRGLGGSVTSQPGFSQSGPRSGAQSGPQSGPQFGSQFGPPYGPPYRSQHGTRSNGSVAPRKQPEQQRGCLFSILMVLVTVLTLWCWG